MYSSSQLTLTSVLFIKQHVIEGGIRYVLMRFWKFRDDSILWEEDKSRVWLESNTLRLLCSYLSSCMLCTFLLTRNKVPRFTEGMRKA